MTGDVVPESAPLAPDRDFETHDVSGQGPDSRGWRAEFASTRLAPAGDLAGRKFDRLTIWLVLGLIGLCGIIAVNVAVIAKGALGGTAAAPPPPAESPKPAKPAAPAPSSVAATSEGTDLAVLFQDEDGVDELSSAGTEPAPHYGSVEHAAARSCSTASVEGLSRQIIEQARCINPNAYVRLPSRKNLVIGPHVFAYLQVAARNHLVRVLDAHPKKTMTINSALRTLAQQYLVRRWSANKRCGVQLATLPGDSNHETGLAVDIAEGGSWRSELAAENFRWLGARDRVHFDYKGSGASPNRSVDVLAFQRLWNRNHPDDRITEDGRYSSATEQRLKKSPADGFPSGPSCRRSRTRKTNPRAVGK